MVTPREALSGPAGAGANTPAAVEPVQSTSGQQVAALGDALAVAGTSGIRLSREMQRDLDSAKFQEASARFAEVLADSEAELEQLRGEEAHRAFDKLRERVDLRRRELERNLTSPRQRRAFGLDADTRQTVSLHRMNAYRGEQLRVHRLGAASASLDRAMRDRVNAAVKGDVTDYIRQSMIMHRKLDQIAELNGLSKEQRDFAKETAEDAVTVGAIEGMIDSGAIARAQAFFESVDGDIQDPQKRSALEQRLKTAGVKQRADLLLPEVREQGSLLQQRRFIRDLDESVEVRDELLRRARQYSSEDRAEQAFAKSTALGEATELALAGQPLPEALETRLSDLGILEQARQLANNTTSHYGARVMETITTQELLAFETPESLHAAYAGHLSHSDRMLLSAKWERANRERLAELAAATGAKSQRSGYAGASEESVVKADLDDMLDQQLTDIYPTWGSLDFSKLSPAQVNARRNLRQAVRDRADAIARASGQKDLTREIAREAVRSVLKVRTDGGRPAFALSSSELADATLVFDFGGEPEEFNVARTGVPGFDPDASAQERYTAMRERLVQAAVPSVMAHFGGELPEARARQLAEGLVGTGDVFEALAYQQRQEREQAEEIGQALDAGMPLTPEQEQAAGPLQREQALAAATARSQWEAMLGPALENAAQEVDRDDEAFIRFWPQFRAGFGAKVRAGFGDRFSLDEDGFRREMIDLLFPAASPEQKHRLWRMSGAWTPPGGTKPIEGYHLKGYLQTTPEIQFSYR